MYIYDSLAEALNDLRKRGYTEDFNVTPERLECTSKDLKFHPSDFTIDEFYRFEGESNPDDNSIVYAISSNEGLKGTLVDAYGVYAHNLNDEMARKLRVSHE